MPSEQPRPRRHARFANHVKRHLRTLALIAGGLGLLLVLLWSGLALVFGTGP